MLLPRQYSFIITILWNIIFIKLVIGNTQVNAQVQQDTSKKISINIIKNKYMEGIKSDTSTLYKFIGDVEFQHGTDKLFCDTAIFKPQLNSLEAFGNVKIIQDNGTTIESKYLDYKGNLKKAYLKGSVVLNNGSDNLWTEELDYDLGTKIGNYYQEGTLQNGTTTVSSIYGTYNVNLKEARFKEQVLVTDTSYTIESNDLGYNTESKIMSIFDTTTIYNESSLLKSSKGTYDSKNYIAHFTNRSSILNDEYYIEGDTINYNKITGLSDASGRVILFDSMQNITLYSGKVFYNDNSKSALSVIKPVLKKMNENDSLFIRADTFYSAHYKMIIDTIKTNIETLSKSHKKSKKTSDSTIIKPNIKFEYKVDTTSPKYYIGYHNVLIFSDSLQGKCDSVCFAGKDSLLILMKSPVLWSRKSQITGDTIIAFIENNSIKKIVVPNDACVVSRTGTEQSNMFNQIQGVSLTAYMQNDELNKVIVCPNAESIYYPTDDDGAYIGVTEAQSDTMHIYFDSGEISRIQMRYNIKQKMSPFDKVIIQNLRLSRFQWLDALRPQSAYELFK